MRAAALYRAYIAGLVCTVCAAANLDAQWKSCDGHQQCGGSASDSMYTMELADAEAQCMANRRCTAIECDESMVPVLCKTYSRLVTEAPCDEAEEGRALRCYIAPYHRTPA